MRRGFGGGAFVSDGDLRYVTDSLSALIRLGSVSIRHLTEARLILEPRVAALAAERRTDDEIARMAEHTDKHAEAIGAGQLHATADLGFHRLVAGASRNPALFLFTNSMADLMVQEVVARLDMDEAVNRSNLEFHRQILEAVRSQDPEAASRLMLAHVTEVQDRLETLLSREP